MASDARTVQFIVDQAKGAGSLTTKKMFGEYALYCDEKVVAFICDDQLFVKPTAAGRAFIGAPREGSPYPGAKPYFLVTEELDEAAWLKELIRITARELPLPKPKKPKTPKKLQA